MADEKKEELQKQLEDITARIAEARRELKALRRHPAEGSRGAGRGVFLSGRERMAEAEEAARQLRILEQQEEEVRAGLESEEG